MPRQRRCATTVLLLALLVPGAAPADDPYEAAMRRAAALESRGDARSAASALAAVAADYPQDFALWLRLGWLSARAGDAPAAERAYRQALSLSPGSTEARLGLAWARLRRGDRAGAHAGFAAVLAVEPDQRSAREGLALTRVVPLRFDPELSTFVLAFDRDPQRSWALGLAAALPALIHERWAASVAYRYSHYFGRSSGSSSGRGPGRGQSASAGFDQHEAYLSAGLAALRVAVLGHYALVHDGSGLSTWAHVAGLSARYSPWGDLSVALSASVYDDLQVYRATPAWRLPLWRWLAVTPALAVVGARASAAHGQLGGATSEVLVSGALSAEVQLGRLRVWVGGKLGDDVRPVLLDVPVIYNLAERMRFGAWGGLALRLGRTAQLSASYEATGLDARDDSGQRTRTSTLHAVTLGGAWTF